MKFFMMDHCYNFYKYTNRVCYSINNVTPVTKRKADEVLDALGFHVFTVSLSFKKSLCSFDTAFLWEITSKRCQHLINWWRKDVRLCCLKLCSNSGLPTYRSMPRPCYGTVTQPKELLNRTARLLQLFSLGTIRNPLESEAFHPCDRQWLQITDSNKCYHRKCALHMLSM